MRVLTVLVTAVLVVPLGACGDDDDGGAQLSRAEFIEQADAICEEESSAVEAAGDELFAAGEPDAEGVRTFLEDVAIPRVESMVDRVAELEPPDDLAEDHEELVELTRGAVEEMRAAADSDDPMALFAGDDPFAASDALALEMGLSGCSDDDDDGEG